LRSLRLRAGFTLVETVVALSLLAVAIAAMLPALVQAMRANTESEIRTGAVAVAQQEVDNLRAQSGTWPSSGQTRAIAAGNGTYQSTLSYQQYCEGATCYAGARIVTVEVRHNGKLYYRVQTVFTSLDATGI
jgi:prepilin-type N-terminal cleavage/methylation domain-containing protein